VNIASSLFSIKWFALCLGILIAIRTKQLGIAFVSLIILAMIMAEGILSTGKGFVATIVLLLIFIDNFLNGRTIRLPLLLIGSVVLVLFSSYSYYSRYYIGFGGESVGGFTGFVNFFDSGDVSGLVTDNLVNIIDRGTYLSRWPHSNDQGWLSN